LIDPVIFACFQVNVLSKQNQKHSQYQYSSLCCVPEMQLKWFWLLI